MQNANITESHWEQTIRGLNSSDSNFIKVKAVSCISKIILVDGISENLAKINYEIRGEHLLYCDTWWEYTDNIWERIDLQRTAEIIESESRRMGKFAF